MQQVMVIPYNVPGQPIGPEMSVRSYHYFLCNSQKNVVLRVININSVRIGRKWLLPYFAVHLPYNIHENILEVSCNNKNIYNLFSL
jgi:hypothetical protein